MFNNSLFFVQNRNLKGFRFFFLNKTCTMNKSHKLLYTLIIFFFLLLLYSFTQQNQNPEVIISVRYTARQNQLLAAINEFRSTLKSADNKSKLTAYSKVRAAFKQWEYLAEYKHPSLFKEKINGAPLPKMEENSFGAIIIQPEGLQVIDEWMGDLKNDSAHYFLDQLSLKLKKTIEQTPNNPSCYDHEILEAGRLELVRLFTLGLTGFDTPGTLSAISDARTVLLTLQQDIELFIPTETTENKIYRNQILAAFILAQNMFKQQQNFSQFNRAKFLTDVFNPLYSGLLDLQMNLMIPMPSEIRSTPSALNYNARHLFSNDLLNPWYYSGLPEKFRTEDVRKLGMLLFFDPVLSENNQRACASCHKPELAFTDGLPKSTATNFTGTVNRNSPTLINCVYSERFFHDLRAEALEDQMTHVVVDEKEFNTSQHKIIEKLQSSPEYTQLFQNAFVQYGSASINPQTLSFAISAYVGSLNSFNSPFDRYARGETKQIEADVLKGFNLFMGKAACGTCHFAPLFSGTVPPDFSESESEVLGVPVQWPSKKPQADNDIGRAAAKIKEQVDIYRHSFKTPGIRNIQKTAPYMHNGGMKTLEAVMDFYNKGGGNGIGLHFEYQTLSSDKLNLSKAEIKQIIAFMNSLTDYESLTTKPLALPKFNDSTLNSRKIGGVY